MLSLALNQPWAGSLLGTLGPGGLRALEGAALLLGPALVGGPEAAPEDGDPVEDRMAPQRWGRLYVRSSGSSSSGVVMLLIERHFPEAKGDRRWTVVDPKRRVQSLDLGSKLVATRLLKGVHYGDFPGLTSGEKSRVLDASAAMVREGSGRTTQVKADPPKASSARLRATHWALGSASSLCATLWARKTLGTAAAAGFAAWRFCVWTDALGWLRWSMDFAREAVETYDEAAEMAETVKAMHVEGRLEPYYMFVSLVGLLLLAK